MTINAYPVLCGGTFFTMVLEARKQRTCKRSLYAGELDGLSQPETLAGLGRVVNPDYVEPKNKDSFSTNASDYKSCENNGTNLAFLFTQEVLSFDTRVKTRYLEALSAMDDFVQRFLEVGTSTAKEVWLVKALLDLIDADQSIDAGQAFYIGEVGQKITKAALREMSDFFFQPFLLGIWHFAVVNRKDNTVGKSTYDIWCPSRGGKERKYAGTMGVGITRSINVTLIEVTGATAKQDQTNSVDNSAPVENGAPVVEDFSEEPASTTTNQTINHPFVFHQYGNNSIQVGNIETLVINNSGGEKREQ